MRAPIESASSIAIVQTSVAWTHWLRLRGLLGRPPLRAGSGRGIFLPNCRSIHMIGMRYAIDVVFVDERFVVVDVREAVRPMRFAKCRRAKHTIELAAGDAALLGLAPGAPVRVELAPWSVIADGAGDA